MLEHTGRIQPLPVEVAARIVSSIAISSLSATVLGLVLNSLEAGSTKIVVNVDFGRGACCVEDDGYGIAPHDFGKDGGLGKPHREWTQGK